MSITSVQGPQENHSSPLLHLFFEPEHTIKVFTLVIVRFAGLRIMRITDELFPVILRKPGKSNVCHTKILLRKKARQQKALSQLFRAHSTSYPTGGLQSFRFTIPYAAAYCPPMTYIKLRAYYILFQTLIQDSTRLRVQIGFKPSPSLHTNL